MHLLGLWIIVASVFSGSRAKAAPSSATESPSIGFFLGINGSHLAQTGRPLHCAANDAVAMAWRYVEELGLISPTNAFILLDGELTGVEREHLDWFRRTDANLIVGTTAREVRSLWETADRRAQAELKRGSLFITFVSGHGAEELGVPYLRVPPERGKTIDLFSLQEIISAMAAMNEESTRFLLVDACRAPLGKGHAEAQADGFTFALKKAQGLLIFSSCAPQQYSYEDEVNGYGIFTSSFLEAARGSFDYGNTDVIPFSAIVDKVSARVREAAASLRNEKQIPTIFGDGEATSIPVGLSPYSPFVRNVFEMRLAAARTKVSTIKKLVQELRPILYTLDGPFDERRKLLIPRIEALPKELTDTDVERFVLWWKRFMERERSSERASYFPKGNSDSSTPVVFGLYCGEDPRGVSKPLLEDLTNALGAVPKLRIKMLSPETAEQLESLLSPPMDLRFELRPEARRRNFFSVNS